MKLSNLGERKILHNLEKFLNIGDDGAFVKVNDKYLIITTDMLYGPTHFLREMSYYQIGKRVVTSCFSDIAAMGALPFGFLLSYGSEDIDYKNFKELILGVNAQCKKFNAEFLGGDTNETYKLTVAGTAAGWTDKPILRSGAKINDLVAITGTVGSSALGVEILTKKIKVKKNLESYLKNVLKFTLESEPRIKGGYFLRKFANSMMDISDSLAVCFYEISRQSKVGMEIDLEKLPYTKSAIKIANELNLNLMNCALYGGGDYQLVFTIPEKNWQKIKNRIDATVIGKVVKKNVIGYLNEEKVKIENRGYEHFVKK